MAKKIIIITFLLVSAVGVGFGMYQINSQPSARVYKILEIEIFKNTPAWELANAVSKQNVALIERITKQSPELLNYQDPKYGETLLLWAVGTEYYQSVDALLKNGADPNIQAMGMGGMTALYEASCYAWVDNDFKQDPKYVKLLLKYGANPEIYFTGNDPADTTEVGTSPLIRSIGCGIEKTKALVEAGADINHKTESGETAAIAALLGGNSDGILGGFHQAYYLVVEKKAKVTDSYGFPKAMLTRYDDPNKKFYPVDLLRYWIYPLDSVEYSMKMEVVAEFKRQGVDYWKTEIPKYTLETIKKIYPDTWQEYIKKY